MRQTSAEVPDLRVSFRRYDIDEGARSAEGRFAEVKRFWQMKCGARSMPARADIDPIEMRAFLGDLYLVDTPHWPARLRFRLVGTNITNFLERDPTGRYFDELYRGEMLDEAMIVHGRAIQSRAPVYLHGSAFFADQRFATMQVLILPLSADQATVDILLCMMVFGAPRRALTLVAASGAA